MHRVYHKWLIHSYIMILSDTFSIPIHTYIHTNKLHTLNFILTSKISDAEIETRGYIKIKVFSFTANNCVLSDGYIYVHA